MWQRRPFLLILRYVINWNAKENVLETALVQIKNVPCFSGCLCQGKVPTCSTAIYFEQNESDSE